jgi:hypothetical protein
MTVLAGMFYIKTVVKEIYHTGKSMLAAIILFVRLT